MLSIKNISIARGRTTIVHDISLKLPTGQLVALLGPNGAGKTTLLTALAGLTPVSSGTIHFQNHDITTLPTHERVTRGIAYMPQHSALFGSLSITDNLRVVYDYHPYWTEKELSEFESQAAELLAHVGLTAISNRTAGVLSGGQKRKVELVRALLMQPQVLLCDEPFAGVDPKSTSELSALFAEIVKQNQITVLLSDHNVAQLLATADYVYMVLAGRVIVHGTSEQILADKITREHYLGSSF